MLLGDGFIILLALFTSSYSLDEGELRILQIHRTIC